MRPGFVSRPALATVSHSHASKLRAEIGRESRHLDVTVRMHRTLCSLIDQACASSRGVHGSWVGTLRSQRQMLVLRAR